MAEEIKLEQLVGSDIYNIDDFNDNTEIIQTYLNKLNDNSFITTIYDDQTTEAINIDDLTSGIYIFDSVQSQYLSGTFPVESYENFQIVSYGKKGESSESQLFLSLDNNNTYFRQKPLNSPSWTDWKTIATDPLIEENNIKLYNITNDSITSQLDINNLDTGIYICKDIDGSKLTGTFPDGVVANANFQIICYGVDNKSYTQTLINLYMGSNVYYNRCKYYNQEAEQWQWSAWSQSKGDITLEVVDEASIVS